MSFNQLKGSSPASAPPPHKTSKTIPGGGNTGPDPRIKIRGMKMCPFLQVECLGPECSIFLKIDETHGACSVTILAEEAVRRTLMKDN